MRRLAALALAVLLGGCGRTPTPDRSDRPADCPRDPGGLTDFERRIGGVRVGTSVDGHETVILPDGTYYMRKDIVGVGPG